MRKCFACEREMSDDEHWFEVGPDSPYAMTVCSACWPMVEEELGEAFPGYEDIPWQKPV